jgi:hypothetical protein
MSTVLFSEKKQPIVRDEDSQIASSLKLNSSAASGRHSSKLNKQADFDFVRKTLPSNHKTNSHVAKNQSTSFMTMPKCYQADQQIEYLRLQAEIEVLLQQLQTLKQKEVSSTQPN